MGLPSMLPSEPSWRQSLLEISATRGPSESRKSLPASGCTPTPSSKEGVTSAPAMCSATPDEFRLKSPLILYQPNTSKLCVRCWYSALNLTELKDYQQR